MPVLLKNSINIIADAGLGMAMFSLGELFCRTSLSSAAVDAVVTVEEKHLTDRCINQGSSWRFNQGSSRADPRWQLSAWPSVSSAGP